jgi:hypothetical protein
VQALQEYLGQVALALLTIAGALWVSRRQGKDLARREADRNASALGAEIAVLRERVDRLVREQDAGSERTEAWRVEFASRVAVLEIQIDRVEQTLGQHTALRHRNAELVATLQGQLSELRGELRHLRGSPTP